ncbi:formyl peptide receptor-related sequence 1-like [Rhinoderma darwinii]|uniref:formyl peptide receptor-related sequence 1-like n=1 Tax=Rhinoderma darwinii TaxID=43563 RepID=UPI003F67E435
MNTSDLNRTFSDITPDYNNQSSYNDNETSIINYDKSSVKLYIVQKMSITLYSIIFALGTIGNGLVIWIAGFRMKGNISAVWFLNLAIADFLCCASLPLRIAEWFLLTSNSSFCILYIILFNMNVSASVLLLTAMSIDHCVSVMWPFWAKVHRTQKLLRITAAVIWVLSLPLTGLVIYLYVFHVDEFFEWCVDGRHPYAFSIKQTIQLIRLVTMFVIPFLIILISYVAIFLKLGKMKRPQRSRRPYRIITAVILCFFICWFPYYIWPLTPMYYEESLNFFMVNIIITNLACLNSCINPIIYVFMAQDFKHGLFLRSILSRLERALSEPPDDECRERGDLEDTRTTDV